MPRCPVQMQRVSNIVDCIYNYKYFPEKLIPDIFTVVQQLNAWQNVIGQISPVYATCLGQINLLITNMFHVLVRPSNGPFLGKLMSHYTCANKWKSNRIRELYFIEFPASDMLAFLSNLQLVAAGDTVELTALSNLEGAISMLANNPFSAQNGSSMGMKITD